MTLTAASDAAIGLGLGYNWNDVGLYAGIMLWVAIIFMIATLAFGNFGNR